MRNANAISNHEFCRKCIHYTFNTERGSICKLSKTKPNFRGICRYFTTSDNDQELVIKSILDKNQKKISREKKSKKNEIQISVTLILISAIAFFAYNYYWNNEIFDTYFQEYQTSIAITQDITHSSKSMGINVGYHYKVGDKIYKSHYYISREGVPSSKQPFGYETLKCPNGKYLIVYSTKDPKYHAFFTYGVKNTTELKKIKLTKEEIKKGFSKSHRSRVIKNISKH